STPSPPLYTLFPYTTLFRSRIRSSPRLLACTKRCLEAFTRRSSIDTKKTCLAHSIGSRHLVIWRSLPAPPRTVICPCSRSTRRRSEEHTSELQSRFDLVCRL